ncbi:MAG: hydroxypyruvate reductase [Planctomycetota bacterium]|nr:MAG: hydroxypyruvate reductase [Planctomycetota bacterium]
MLREHAIEIWKAGVAAVASERLVRNVVSCDGRTLTVCQNEFDVASLNRIVVLGTGKAGAGMAGSVESILGESLTDSKVTGWVNVPADCVRPLRRIVLHAARPAGLNEPTEAGVIGTQRILELARSAGANDLVIVLISGGGSALSPAPISGISLADKQAVTRFLMRSGATIQELNTVRKHLSSFKGGGLARAASQARAVITLVISELDVIASGPTVEDTTKADEALAVLQRFGARPPDVPDSVFASLRSESQSSTTGLGVCETPKQVHSHVIGNNDTAVDAAVLKACEFGYFTLSSKCDVAGEAQHVGRQIADECRQLREHPLVKGVSRYCIVSGGEPIVKLVPTDRPHKGGRNQEVALAALQSLWSDGLDRIAILSGGTDGEDGPTNAAGAVVDEPLRQIAIANGLDPVEFLAINNSYPFFEQTGGLLLTGPTHTNVMDLRVAVVH